MVRAATSLQELPSICQFGELIANYKPQSVCSSKGMNAGDLEPGWSQGAGHNRSTMHSEPSTQSHLASFGWPGEARHHHLPNSPLDRLAHAKASRLAAGVSRHFLVHPKWRWLYIWNREMRNARRRNNSWATRMGIHRSATGSNSPRECLIMDSIRLWCWPRQAFLSLRYIYTDTWESPVRQ